MAYLDALIQRLFVPPPMPMPDLGWGGKLKGAEGAVRNAFTASYWAGVKDGFLVGMIAGLLVIVVIVAVLIINRVNLTNPLKVAGDAIKSL